MEKPRFNLFKIIVGACALVMCLFFFIMPIMMEDPYYVGPWGGDSGTGLDVAVGNFGRGFPVAWLLLIFPAVLAILAFLNQSFKILCGASIVCLIGQIIFVSVASNFGDELTRVCQ